MFTRSIALVLATLVGCAQSPSPSPAQQTPAAPVTEPHEMHEMQQPSGAAILLFAALHHFDLSAEQRTTIETAAHAIASEMPVDHRVFAEVAAGLRAGKLDEARVLAILDTPSADRTGSPASALATLHATLRPEQRRALVDLIAEHIDERETAAGSPGPEGKFEQVLAKLNLTSDQRASIDRIVAAQPADEDSHARMVAFHTGLRAQLETFATDQFDAAAFVAASPAGATGMRGHVQRTLHMVAAILPVLDPTQRETLAAMIEAGPLHR